jgi:enoyl-CoA hydratase/carnithine racemase
MERYEQVALVTLNRPVAMNSFTTEMAMQFNDVMRKLSAEPETRVIVITGAGSKAFCTGADLKERNGMTSAQWKYQHKIFEEKNRLVRDCPKPVIGAINGYAVGGGLELALQMDFLVASKEARFGQPEVKRGIIPGGGGTQWLPRRVPLGAAVELLLTGDVISAEVALRLGLVNAVIVPDELIAVAVARAGTIAVNSPAAVQQVRKAVRMGAGISIEQALDIELECYARMIDHPDRIEGVAAFVEKRPARFSNVT